MNAQQIVEELLVVLESNGVKIRREPLGGGGGGLCVVKGEKIFFLDTQSATAELAALCAEAVAKVIDVEAIYLRPEIRQFIEKFSGGQKE